MHPEVIRIRDPHTVIVPEAIVEPRERDIAFRGKLIIEQSRLNKDLLQDPSKSCHRLAMNHSGIRGWFGPGPDISEEAKTIAASFAYTYACDVIQRWKEVEPTKNRFSLLVGRETRPTGQIISEIHTAAFLMAGEDMGVELDLINLGITTTPVLENTVRALKADGAVMITASHNPSEDNGFKYTTGFKEPEENSINNGGALLNPDKKLRVIAKSKELLNSEHIDDFINRFNYYVEVDGAIIEARADCTSSTSIANRELSVIEYIRFVQDIAGVGDSELEALRKLNAEKKIIVDPGGGGGCQIVASVLKHFGFEVIEINGVSGIHRERIEPVEEGMAPAIVAMKKYCASAALVGDCDFDRGNYLFLDSKGEVVELAPQRCAALNLLSNLAWADVHAQNIPDRYRAGFAEGNKQLKDKAVVFHHATSHSLHDIAAEFGARVRVVDVGEVNLIQAMHRLEDEGYFNGGCYEAYNGGSAPRGSMVRDGTLSFLLTLLATESVDVVNFARRSMGFGDVTEPSVAAMVEAIPPYTSLHDAVELSLSVEPKSFIESLRESVLNQIPDLLKFEKSHDRVKGLLTTVYGIGDQEFSVNNVCFNRLKIEKIHVSTLSGSQISFIDDQEQFHSIWFRFSGTESAGAGKLRIGIDSPDEQIALELERLLKYLIRSSELATVLEQPELMKEPNAMT